jgi:hypothetical protein
VYNAAIRSKTVTITGPHTRKVTGITPTFGDMIPLIPAEVNLELASKISPVSNFTDPLSNNERRECLISHTWCQITKDEVSYFTNSVSNNERQKRLNIVNLLLNSLAEYIFPLTAIHRERISKKLYRKTEKCL